jgi:hypothetical protein
MKILKATYNIDDQVFNSLKTYSHFRNDRRFFLSDELESADKIAMIDEFKDGIASYVLNILEKYAMEKGSLPQNSYGSPKTVSLKAWLKKNDPREHFCFSTYDGVSYYMFGREFTNLELICGNSKHGNQMPYTLRGVENQWFHDFLVEMGKEEDTWFANNDPHMLKLEKVRKLGREFGVFGNKLLNDVVHNRADTTDENLGLFIMKYELMQAFCEKIGKELEGVK